MRKPELLVLWMFFAFIQLNTYAQNPKSQHFSMLGENPKTIEIDRIIDTETTLFPFGKNVNRIYGLAVTADINFVEPGGDFQVNLIMTDENGEEYLLFETHDNMESDEFISLDSYSDETCILNGVRPSSLRVETKNATVSLKSLQYATGVKAGWDIAAKWKEQKLLQNEDKIQKINSSLKAKGRHWVAGPTSVSEMSYGERKKLYGKSAFPAGFEFYTGGVIMAGSTESGSATGGSGLKSATAASPYVDIWDWRDRHGKNWITPVQNQSICGACWAFAAAGAVEAMVNLYFNQLRNLDLSEQDLLSCSGAGSCDGGYPKFALDYIAGTGIVDEAAFPYQKTQLACNTKGSNPAQLIKIAGKNNFYEYSSTEDDLKHMLIHDGVVSGGLTDWAHTMVLVGYKVVKEGDTFYYRDLDRSTYWFTVAAGDPLIGKTVWIFKNSWGKYFGDQGYVYVETPITNMHWTHSIQTPITSVVEPLNVVYEDRDGDGYYWWGIGPKPAGCPGPDLADGNDADPTLGPIDEYGHCMVIGTSTKPVANFSANSREVKQGESVQFTDASTNNPSAWSWTFEGGNPSTSTEQNPVVSFDKIGYYKVSLTVTNASGSDTKAIDNYIGVSSPLNPPIANFTSTDRFINVNESISFTDASSNIPTSWSWNFPGGTPATSNQQNPTITYNTTGTYDVALTATNADGSYTKTIKGYVVVSNTAPPVANFAANKTSLNTGESVQFSDLSSNSPSSWSWKFTGGTPSTSTVKNPTVSYNTTGTFAVELTVANQDGSDTKTINGYITVTSPVVNLYPPVASFGASSSQTEAGGSVTFSDQSSNAPTSRTWTFEGGSPATSSAQNPVVSYASVGSYDVTLVVRNADGADTLVKSNYISVSQPVVKPVADFIADKTNINEGETVSFQDKSANTPASWLWKFEGGTPSQSTAKNPKVTYTNAASYRVELTVTNSKGESTKAIDNYIQVSAPKPEYCIPTPVASAEWIKSVRINGQAFNCTPSGYTDNTAKTIQLESGSTFDIRLEPGFDSRSKFEYWSVWIDLNQDLKFSDNELLFSSDKSKTAVSGSISIPAGIELTSRLRVAMGNVAPAPCMGSVAGDAEDYTVVITAPVPQAPVADFAANVYSITAGESIQFSDLSSNAPTSWSWNFPGADQGNSSAQNPLIKYSTPGTYDVSLTVGKTGFASSTKTRTAIITVSQSGQSDYCTPVNIIRSSNYISRVDIGAGYSISSGFDGYSTHGEELKLVRGETYKVTLTPADDRERSFWKIWIDLNNDGDFDDSDETLLTVNNNRGVASAWLTIPYYASGSAKMRVSLKNGKTPAACDDNFEGEVEDYNLNFGVQPGQGVISSTPLQDDENGNFISVFPNPVNDILKIRIREAGSNDSFAIYNVAGVKIMEERITSSLQQVDLSDQPAGVYLVIIQSEYMNYTSKVVKR